jgi:hypothetical protein
LRAEISLIVNNDVSYPILWIRGRRTGPHESWLTKLCILPIFSKLRYQNRELCLKWIYRKREKADSQHTRHFSVQRTDHQPDYGILREEMTWLGIRESLSHLLYGELKQLSGSMYLMLFTILSAFSFLQCWNSSILI